jgi:hypothetical protein
MILRRKLEKSLKVSRFCNFKQDKIRLEMKKKISRICHSTLENFTLQKNQSKDYSLSYVMRLIISSHSNQIKTHKLFHMFNKHVGVELKWCLWRLLFVVIAHQIRDQTVPVVDGPGELWVIGQNKRIRRDSTGNY